MVFGFHADAVHMELHQTSPAVLNAKTTTLTVAGWTGICRLVSLAKVAALANMSEDEAVHGELRGTSIVIGVISK